jgi:hypothetical protein
MSFKRHESFTFFESSNQKKLSSEIRLSVKLNIKKGNPKKISNFIDKIIIRKKLYSS